VTAAAPDAAGDHAALASTELAGGTARGAIESTIVEMIAWRREAEKRIAYLETEILHLRRGGTGAGPSLPGPDLHRDQTAPLFPEFDPAPAAAAAPWAPAPLVSAQPKAAPAPAPEVGASIVPVRVSASMMPIVRRVEPRPQYDLEMRPGEFLDLPDELDGSKKKKYLVGFLLFLILGGMSALIITALASQR
jgi:hypothetical protein